MSDQELAARALELVGVVYADRHQPYRLAHNVSAATIYGHQDGREVALADHESAFTVGLPSGPYAGPLARLVDFLEYEARFPTPPAANA